MQVWRSSGPGDAGLGLLHQLEIIARRKWLVLAVAAATVGTGILHRAWQAPLYHATVRLQVERPAALPVDTPSSSIAEPSSAESLRTQIEMLKGRAIATRVAALANPSASPEALTDSIAAATVVRQVPGSRLVDITCQDPSADRAARLANAYAAAIMAHGLETRQTALDLARDRLRDQARLLHDRVLAADKALLEFAAEAGIIVLGERSSVVERSLAAAGDTLSAMTNERIRAEQNWRQVEARDAHDVPQLLASPAIQALRTSRKQLQTEYQEKLGTFRPAYPAMVEITTKLKEIDRQLKTEADTIRASLKAAFEASIAQERLALERVHTLQAHVHDMKKGLVRHDALKREADTSRALHDDIRQRLKQIELAGSTVAPGVLVIERASVPAAPVTLALGRALLLWLGLGLGAGVLAAAALEIIDDTVRTPEALERLSGLPVLGVVPLSTSVSQAHLELEHPSSPLSEAYRALCASLPASRQRGMPRAILITSAAAAEGKSLTALAIARQLSAWGLRVLIIDGDLRRPTMHVRLGLPNGVGLVNCLAGACTAASAVQATQSPNLAVMTSGSVPVNAADLLAGPALGFLIEAATSAFDLVLIDGPPTMEFADAQLLAMASSATLLVVAAGEARARAVERAVQRLRLAGATISGAVLTKCAWRRAGVRPDDRPQRT